MALKVGFGQKGAIVKIRLRNFMTYKDCTLKPAGNLNMIIGPNGSGKSAIVCAIIVGLAGEVSLTGRATSITSLVRRGCDECSTTIELWGGKGSKANDVVERRIVITSRAEGKLEHKSEWKLNGRSVTMRIIRDLMEKLNIKVDNLCQFLPQDSVASFVKMSHSELLVNTLKAAGDVQLVEDLEKLTEFTRDISEHTAQLEDLKKSSEENAVNARRLETEVERLREREKLAKEKIICSKKIDYVKYLEAKDALTERQAEIKAKQNLMKQAQRDCEPFKLEAENCGVLKSTLHNSIVQIDDESKKHLKANEQIEHSLENRKLECQNEFARFKTREKEETQREQQIRSKQQELEGYECRLNEMRDVDYSKGIQLLKTTADDKKKQLLENDREKKSIDEKLRGLVRHREFLKSQRDQIKAVREKKINVIMTRRRETFRVVEWLSKQPDNFRSEIYLPMLCEINVKDVGDAAVVEHAIPESDQFAFVCRNENVLKSFTRAAQELKASVNVILIPDRTVEEFERDNPSHNKYSNLNFKAYLKDLIDAPEEIMRYLYGQHGFHMIPVFNELSEKDLKTVMQTCKRFYVGKKFYQISQSRYDNATMTVSDTVRDARNLIYSLDKKQLQTCIRQLNECEQQISELENAKVEVLREYENKQKEWSELAKRVSDLTVKQGEKTRLVTLTKMCQDRIKELQTDRIDIEAERRSLRGSIENINRNMVKDLGKLKTSFQKYVKTREKLHLILLQEKIAKINHDVAHRRYTEALKNATQTESVIRELKRTVVSLEDQVKQTRLIAEEKIPGFKEGKIDTRTQKVFADIEEETVEELERRVETLKARIRGICRDPNNQLLDDYNRQHEELRDKQKKISDLKTSLEMMETSRREIKENFIPKLDKLIKVIDEHYRDFMRKLNYDGKVELSLNEANKDDFSNYGINIMVKYRDNEQLISLSSTRQSGGERSVATMIYMLALQTQTTVPFRVVDEINQGMDKDNERKVFELLVRTADESSSQYFLVSPKLLSGLHYGEKMQIHTVFNGPKLNFSFNDLMRGDSDGDEAYSGSGSGSDTE